MNQGTENPMKNQTSWSENQPCLQFCYYSTNASTNQNQKSSSNKWNALLTICYFPISNLHDSPPSPARYCPHPSSFAGTGRGRAPEKTEKALGTGYLALHFYYEAHREPPLTNIVFSGDAKTILTSGKKVVTRFQHIRISREAHSTKFSKCYLLMDIEHLCFTSTTRLIVNLIRPILSCFRYCLHNHPNQSVLSHQRGPILRARQKSTNACKASKLQLLMENAHLCFTCATRFIVNLLDQFFSDWTVQNNNKNIFSKKLENRERVFFSRTTFMFHMVQSILDESLDQYYSVLMFQEINR